MFRQRLQRLQRLQKQKQKQFQKQFQKQKQNLKNNRVLRMETGTQMMIMSEVLRSEMIYLFNRDITDIGGVEELKKESRPNDRELKIDK